MAVMKQCELDSQLEQWGQVECKLGQGLQAMWFLDTLIAKVKLLLGNKCASVFMNGKLAKVVPIVSHADSGESLIDFMDDVGIPKMLMTNGTGVFTGRHIDCIKHAWRM
jgi:hypothetical protein